jgi:hypothetical protein
MGKTAGSALRSNTTSCMGISESTIEEYSPRTPFDGERHFSFPTKSAESQLATTYPKVAGLKALAR